MPELRHRDRRRNASSHALAFGLFLVGVLGLKLFVGLSLGSHPLLDPGVVAPNLEGLDAAYYRHLAERVNAGDFWLLDPASFFGRPAPAFFISPLYIYVLAALLKLGASLALVRAAQLVLGTAAVWLVALTARRWFGARAGWIAAVLMAGCGLFTFYETLILQAALDPFLTTLDLYLVTRAVQDGRRRDWLAAGAAIGLHALNRPNMLVVVLAVATAIALRARRKSVAPRPALTAAALFLLAAVVVLVPATVRNYRATGEVVLISSHGGLNFLIGNGPDADGTFATAMGVPPTIRGQWIDAERIASDAAGRPLSAGQSSAFFRQRAREWIAAHPAAEIGLLARKTRLVLSDVFLTLNYSFPFYARDTGSALRYLFVDHALLVALGVVGLTIGRSKRAGFMIISVFSVSSVLSVVLFFVAARYRIPFQVTLIVTAAGAISWAVDRVRDRAWMPLGGAIAIAAAAGLLAASPTGLDNGRSEEMVRMGLLELDRGRVEDGERWISKALTAGHPFAGVAHLRAGQIHEAAGRPREALTHYRRALEIDPDEPALRLADARALNGLGQAAAAIASLDRIPPSIMSEAAGREYERAGLSLASTRRDADLAAAINAFVKAESRLPRSPSVRLNRGVALAMLGRTQEARAAAESALTLDPGYALAREFLERIR